MSSQSTAAIELDRSTNGPVSELANESERPLVPNLEKATKRKASHKKVAKINAPAFVRQQVGYIALFTSWMAGLLFAPALGKDPTSMTALALSMVIVAVFFLIQEPVALLESAFRENHPYKKRWQPYAWIGALVVGLIGAGIPLFSMRPGIQWLAIPAFALFGAYLVLRRLGAHQIILSMVGFAALAVAAPIGRVAAHAGYTWQELAAIWILPAAFFSLSIMTLHIRRTGESAVNGALYYSGMLVTLIGFLIAFNVMPWIAMPVILIQVVKLGYIATHAEEYSRWPIGSVNMMETIFAVLFLLINAFG
jgi:hypothetical protein